MEENTNADIFAQLLWAATGETPLSLMVMSFDLIFSVATLAFLAIGTISLLKGARPGSLYIAFGFAGLVVAVVGAPVLAFFAEEEGITEDMLDLLGLYIGACTAVSAYGFFRLSRFLKHERAGEKA